MSYYVTGGRYADTTFTTLLESAGALGPFATREEALEAWRERARATIDFATVRYQVTWQDGDGQPPAPAVHAPDAVA